MSVDPSVSIQMTECTLPFFCLLILDREYLINMILRHLGHALHRNERVEPSPSDTLVLEWQSLIWKWSVLFASLGCL